MTSLNWAQWAALLLLAMFAAAVLTIAAAWLFGTKMDRTEIQDTFHRFLDASHKERE